MAFPPQKYYTIEEVAAEWNVASRTVTKAILTSDLVCHFWLDKVVVYHFTEEDEGNTTRISKKLVSMSGYLPMYPEDCRILLKHNQVALRKFKGQIKNEYYWLPQRSSDVLIQPDDIVILRDEKIRFEDDYGLKSHKSKMITSFNKDETAKHFEFSGDYREVKIGDEVFFLGELQSKIIKALYIASQTNLPWVNGKQLLHSVNSSSFVMRDVFKSNANWRNLIVSDGRGRYRLNV